jgi:hypothetical protein
MKNLVTARSSSTRTNRARIRGTRFAGVIVAISTAVVLTSCNVINTLPLSDIPTDIEDHVGIPVVDEANVEGLVFFLDRSEGVLHVPDQERLAKFIAEGALEPIQWAPGSSTAVIVFAAGNVPERQTVRVQATRRADLFAFPARPGDWRFFADARERHTTPVNVRPCRNRLQQVSFNGGQSFFSTASYIRTTRHHEYLLDTAEIETAIERVEVVTRTARYARAGCTGAGDPWIDNGLGYWVVLVRSWP